MADTTDQPELNAIPAPLGNRDRAAIDRVLPLIYEELRRIAHFRLRAEQTGHTLETTGLVHEAYLRLVGSEHSRVRESRAFSRDRGTGDAAHSH